MVTNKMKMGNIAPRAGIKLTSLAYLARVQTIKPARLPDIITIHTPHFVYWGFLGWEVSADYYTCSPGILSLLIGHLIFTIKYN